MSRTFLNFAKSCILSGLSKFDNTKKFTMPFLNYKPLKLWLRVFVADPTVANILCRENNNNGLTNGCPFLCFFRDVNVVSDVKDDSRLLKRLV